MKFLEFLTLRKKPHKNVCPCNKTNIAKLVSFRLRNNDTLYQDKLTTHKKPTVGYSIPDEIPTTCFQLCELV